MTLNSKDQVSPKENKCPQETKLSPHSKQIYDCCIQKTIMHCGCIVDAVHVFLSKQKLKKIYLCIKFHYKYIRFCSCFDLRHLALVHFTLNKLTSSQLQIKILYLSF